MGFWDDLATVLLDPSSVSLATKKTVEEAAKAVAEAAAKAAEEKAKAAAEAAAKAAEAAAKAAADVADKAAADAANKAAAEAAAKAAEAATAATAVISYATATVASYVPATVEAEEKWGKVCCPLFQIQDDFLLDARTGAVWKYDSNSNSFKLVPKETTDLQKAALRVTYAVVTEQVQAAKTKESARLLPVLRKDFEENIDILTKLLIAKQKELLPSKPITIPRPSPRSGPRSIR